MGESLGDVLVVLHANVNPSSGKDDYENADEHEAFKREGTHRGVILP